MSGGKGCNQETPPKDKTKNKSGCCPSDTADGKGKKIDKLYAFSLFVITISIAASFIWPLFSKDTPAHLHHFANACIDILSTMWIGVVFGIVMVGLMSKIPRAFFTSMMGSGDSFSGLIRAVSAGVLLDLCSHGILFIAAKMYERGISLAQVIAFLVASPWNSISLTFILIALVGLKLTLLYIFCSLIIAFITGYVFQRLTRAGVFPQNPNTPEIDDNFKFGEEFKALIKNAKPSKRAIFEILKSGWIDGQMIIKWLLFGTIIAAAIRSFIAPEIFAQWLGPTVAGLFITLIFATIVEICSEGAAPIAGEIVTNANAPGNGFAFLMAGVATDYTEIMIVRDFAKSWTVALAIPLITVPQILLIGWIINISS